MSKEMYISSSPHETKVAVLEDDQLVEVYFERDTDVGLVGGIYKGRVSRVLPGMQSAFVDIGLERDAFLYVSDFFYENQEEYDKVFEEAEARASKFTAQPTEATAAPMAGPVTEVPSNAVAEVAPAAAAPQVAPSPTEATADTVAPPAPTPPVGSREPYERRPYDPRRGRRRRHRGRSDFGEGRQGERRFPPPHRAEEAPTESHAFEILPGESLAKYSHAAPAPSAQGERQVAQAALDSDGGNDAARVDATTNNVSGQDDDFGSANSPVVQAYENSAQAQFDHESVAEAPESESANTHLPSEPAVQSAEIDFAPAAEVSAQAPAAAVTAVVTDEMPSIAPSATQAAAASNGKGAVSTEGAEPSAAATVSSASASGEERAPAEQPLSAASSAAERERQPQIPGSPSSPSFEPEVAASYSVEGVAGPSSGKPEPSTAVSAPSSLAADRPEGVPATVGSEAAEAAAPFDTAETESPSERAELDVADEDGEVEEEMEEEDFAEGPDEELTEDSETEPSAEGESDRELPTGVAAGAEGESETVTGSAGAGSSAESGAPGDRSYTLREPHQRPRFAPRRRRGRRVPGGAPRRFDRPRESSRPGNHHPVQIAEVLKEGQEILVQIAKEPLGTKGARITSHVALPGRYLVYMPTIEHIGVSRKIVSEEERLRLRNIILENKGSLTGGFIVRTAGQGRSDEEFKADLKFLSTLWADIRAKADRLKAPALLHRDLDLVQRLLRDLLTPDFKSVRVDNEIDYERVLDFVNRCQPGLIGKVKLYSRDTPLYEEFGIQQEIEKALKPKVWLKSGGYIVINQTEALVAIDVNTGKYVGKTNRLEDTIVKTNVDAVNEIVRQVRLRDLGGIIVIDFIDMDERKNRAKVVQALEEALRSDRAPTKVISFNDFGLVAVTRKRVKQSLERALCQPCDYCSGSGWVKSVNTVCNEILAEARKMANEIDGNVITLRVNPEVAKALKSREGGLLSELESMVKKDVIIKSDPSVHQERFEIY